jgi:hypothetical protein
VLRGTLTPYFTINHPIRGSIRGPYHKLPSSKTSIALRTLALDVVVTLASLFQPREGDELMRAVDTAVLGTEEKKYWDQVKPGRMGG